MDVIVLHREMEEPEAAARGDGKGTPNGGEDARATQTADRTRRAQGDVDGMRSHVLQTLGMRHAGATTGGRLPASTTAVTTPAAGRGQRELHGTCHLDSVLILAL